MTTVDNNKIRSQYAGSEDLESNETDFIMNSQHYCHLSL